MQQSCAAANLARLPLPVVPGLEDLASLFLARNGPVPAAHDYSSSFDFDVVVGLDPSYYYYPSHSCDGGVAIATPVSSVSAERKRRRLASNRASARRSRARRQRRLDELSLRAAELLGANQRLLVELNRVVARHGAVARENARLREETAGLRRRLGEVEVGEAAAAAAAGQGPLRAPS
jgi:hypothetical protein